MKYKETPLVAKDKVKVGRKFYFINDTGEKLTTEEYAVWWLMKNGYTVLRTEVSVWQALTAIVYYDIIFSNMTEIPKETLIKILPESADVNDVFLTGLSDTPLDYFRGDLFYRRKETEIIERRDSMRQGRISIVLWKNYLRYMRSIRCTRLIGEGIGHLKWNMMKYSKMIRVMGGEEFSLVTTHIIENPSAHRAGLPDFYAWKNGKGRHYEVKRKREWLRDSQKHWLDLFEENNIDYSILRISP